MRETTIDDRRAELRGLLDRIQAHPERDHTAERRRVVVFQAMLRAHDHAGTPAWETSA